MNTATTPTPGAAAQRWQRSSHDIDQQAALLPDWPQEYLQLEPGRLHSEVQGLLLDGPVGLLRKSTDRRLVKSFCTPADTLALAVLAPGSAPVLFQGRPAQAGQALLLPPGQSFDIATQGRFDVCVATVTAPRLQAWGCDADTLPACVLPQGPATRALAHHMQALLAGGSPGPGSPWALEACILDALPAAPVAAGDDDRCAAAALRAARRLLTDMASASATGEPPGVATLARQLGVSPRWLHRTCAQRLGLPPGRYAQRLRLARVRAELQQGGAAPVSVSDTAMKWGFTHLGRFASAYRAAYGELPSQTLRGAGREPVVH